MAGVKRFRPQLGRGAEQDQNLQAIQASIDDLATASESRVPTVTTRAYIYGTVVNGVPTPTVSLGCNVTGVTATAVTIALVTPLSDYWVHVTNQLVGNTSSYIVTARTSGEFSIRAVNAGGTLLTMTAGTYTFAVEVRR